MTQDFLKKFLNLIKKGFIILFTIQKEEAATLSNLTLSNWRTISHPILHSNNTLSVFDYNNRIVRNALFYIKNKKEVTLLNQMCQILVDVLAEDLADKHIVENFSDPILVSIPSSRKHMMKRGYNPSDIIAKEISRLSSINYLTRVISKSKHTPEQKTLTRYNRLKNVRNSMRISPKFEDQVKDRCIIVVDDIMTTGATLREARRVLLKAGAKKVMGVVLAH